MEIEQQLENISKEDTTKGENYYARKFKSCYQIVRKSLVVLNKARSKEGNEKIVELTKDMLVKAFKSLE